MTTPPAASRWMILAGLLFLAGTGSAGCSVLVQLPTTPRLQNLSEEQVFAMAPAPEWPQPQADSPTSAAVDVSCGVGQRTSTGILYAAVAVKGRPAAGTLSPLNVSLVLDRSGSMAGAPFRNMVTAAEAFVNQMRDGDRVSVIAFSDGVWEAVPSVVLDPNTRAAAVANIRAMADGGGTYFSGGLLAGLAEVFGAFQEWQVNQVVLFSDGQPNIGITSSFELARIAARAAERGVNVSTIGFGHEHDELLMQGIADASGGLYDYVDSPGDMSRIFQRQAGVILRSASRATQIDLAIPQGLTFQDVIGYDYYLAGNHVYVNLGSVPHDEDRYAVFKFQPSGGGQLPLDLVYADVTRRGRFGVSCALPYDGARGGNDAWALELAGRAEAAWGLQEAMAWADSGSELFVISQLGYTRGIIATLRENLGPQALADEDKMLLGAQADLGMKVASGAAQSLMGGGVGGLLNFGANQAVSNATTAVVYKVDQSFRPRVRVGMPVTYWGGQMTLYPSRGTPYKPHDHDASIRYKRARYRSYHMMRTRSGN